MRLATPYELGCIAADVADVSGMHFPNPFSAGSLNAARWQQGFEEETARLAEEQLDAEQRADLRSRRPD